MHWPQALMSAIAKPAAKCCISAVRRKRHMVFCYQMPSKLANSSHGGYTYTPRQKRLVNRCRAGYPRALQLTGQKVLLNSDPSRSARITDGRHLSKPAASPLSAPAPLLMSRHQPCSTLSLPTPAASAARDQRKQTIGLKSELEQTSPPHWEASSSPYQLPNARRGIFRKRPGTRVRAPVEALSHHVRPGRGRQAGSPALQDSTVLPCRPMGQAPVEGQALRLDQRMRLLHRLPGISPPAQAILRVLISAGGLGSARCRSSLQAA